MRFGVVGLRRPVRSTRWRGRSGCVVFAVGVVVGGLLASAGASAVAVPASATSGWAVRAFDASQLIGADSVSCGNRLHCVTVGGTADRGPGEMVTSDGGASWSPAELPVDVATVGPVACASARRCTALATTVSYAQVALVSRDGGLTWTDRPLPIRASGLSCPTSTV